ncbi:MAG: bifunctional hydroxymethylpyrimidine kinase/phosphomethylpyrimidine kinase [Planctomycetes bacterium]|nr:bifunctional hydroxymethylpyrimidine kinase/phosphomethylpyrimidine kinase [Planctomycetota bacterium]
MAGPWGRAPLCVAVLGDVIADHWLHASPSRLSREAPVLVLRHEREELACGGAANVARNLRAMGARVALFGATGLDASGREIAAALAAEGVDVAGLEAVPGWTTPAKTRVLAAEPRRNPQQILRIDREPSAPLDPAARSRAALRTVARLGEFDALLLSDYEYGAVGVEAAEAARAFTAAGRVAVLDPRRGLERFRGALTALTPNVGELAAFARRPEALLAAPRELSAAARELVEAVAPRHLLVTRGNLGMALFDAAEHAAGAWVEASGEGLVTDVTGAGDTAAAAFTLALAAGQGALEAMRAANAAAGIVVMRPGAATCDADELEAALRAAPRPTAVALEGA